MKPWLLLLLTVACSLTGGEIEMIPGPPTAVFGGATNRMTVTFRNRSNQTVEAALRIQVVQASSATVAPTGPPTDWKSLTLLPRQTLLEQAVVDLPVVRSWTRFLLRFSNGESILGTLEVWAYPSNLLTELRVLLDDQPVLVSGIDESWKDLLARAGVRTLEMAETVPPPGSKRLAILRSFMINASESSLANAVSLLAKAGTGVVWIKAASVPEGTVEPSYYALKLSNATVVVAQDSAVTNLAADPWAQARLLRMARLATGRETLILPNAAN